MNARIMASVLTAALTLNGPALAQTAPQKPAATKPAAPELAGSAERYIDPVAGLSLEQAIARALERQPSLREIRSEVDVAQGMRLQASLRPNPTVSFERREEPAGMDNQTMVAVEWPLDLFRRSRRVAVADRELTAAQLAVGDGERLLAAEVRMRYGGVVAAVRDLAIVDELVAATRRQHELLRARAEEGATPPLERDLLDVELRRLESDRLLQAGRTEAALFELKRALGMAANEALTVKDSLEDLVRGDASSMMLAGSEAQTAVESRPDVREAAARVDVADARIDRVAAEGRFDVSLFANYMRMDAGFPQQGLSLTGMPTPIRGVFHYASAGAMVMLPLFNRNQGDVAAARAEREAAAAAHEAVALAADAEVAAARARDEHAQRAANVYATGVQALARQNLAVVSESYDLGRLTVFDVLDEQRRFLEIERAYTEALMAAYEARTELRRALGGVR